ncbi:Uncharacterized protein TPAR_03480 [Tolypocladium paradoxum]|uniref:cellulase n=1 Tax=Tolypocladium paradoxum TaxID=94208 RepID=A0A2S4L1I2_9HYPO|nr:Uncharacterized protein TPAR_03480 [Tolypocladium paradoxum]
MTALATSGSGHSSRYWDCGKPSCAWSGKASVSAAVRTCDKNDNPLSDPNTKSGCDGGTAFACTNNSPWAVNDNLAYGFAATAINSGTESSWCCACSVPPTRGDLMVPGGGVGIFDGCTPEFGGVPGDRYGGVASRDQCGQMPAKRQAGCFWRFDWFLNADNPDFDFQLVK